VLSVSSVAEPAPRAEPLAYSVRSLKSDGFGYRPHEDCCSAQGARGTHTPTHRTVAASGGYAYSSSVPRWAAGRAWQALAAVRLSSASGRAASARGLRVGERSYEGPGRFLLCV